MKFSFDENINNFLKIITKSALEQKTRVFFVGGLVRDNLMGTHSKDIDLLVLANAIEFAKNLPETIQIKSIHKDFATVKVIYNDLIVDIASTRVEKYPFSGCLPIVEKIGVDIIEDYKRRDFSVNSLYCELKLNNNNLEYELIDLCCGVDDIKTKTLRVLHNKSYIDDPTRILRGLGFKYRFGFDFSEYDKKLISSYLKNIDSSKASYDRIYSIFKKIFLNVNSFDIFKEVVKEKYYKIIFNDELNFDYKKIEDIIKIFNLKNEKKADFFLLLLENKMVEKQESTDLSEIFESFLKFDEAYLSYYFYKTNDEKVLFYIKNKDVKILLKGSDLIKMGYKQGKIFSKILKSLFSAKLNNQAVFSSIDDEKAWVNSNFPLV